MKNIFATLFFPNVLSAAATASNQRCTYGFIYLFLLYSSSSSFTLFPLTRLFLLFIFRLPHMKLVAVSSQSTLRPTNITHKPLVLPNHDNDVCVMCWSFSDDYDDDDDRNDYIGQQSVTIPFPQQIELYYGQQGSISLPA